MNNDDSMPKHQGEQLRVCMLSYSFYDTDNRVMRYAEALARRGDTVDVLALGHEANTHRQIDGVNVYYIQKRVHDEKRKISYLLKILTFLFKSALIVTKKHFQAPYDIIHVHSVPDFEVFAALIPKLLGAKIILDIHDPVPDFFSAKFGYPEKSIYYRLLKAIEWASALLADHVITVTDYWRNRIKERSRIADNKISVIVNYPDLSKFHIPTELAEKALNKTSFTILYPGTLNAHCGVDLVVKAVKVLENRIPKIRFDIYGSGTEQNTLKKLVKDLNLEGSVVFHNPVPFNKIPLLMAEADMGIALLAGQSKYARQALNVKLFEFLAMGVPVVASRVESIEYYLGQDTVMLSSQNDVEDIARCIETLYNDPQKRAALRAHGFDYVKKNNSQTEMTKYIAIIEALSRK